MFKKRLIAGFALIGVLTAAALAYAQSYPPPQVPTIHAVTDLVPISPNGAPTAQGLAGCSGANLECAAICQGHADDGGRSIRCELLQQLFRAGAELPPHRSDHDDALQLRHGGTGAIRRRAGMCDGFRRRDHAISTSSRQPVRP